MNSLSNKTIQRFLKSLIVLPKGRTVLRKCVIPLFPSSMRTLLAEVHGLKMHLDLGQDLDFDYFLGHYDSEELEFLTRFYEEGSYFLDIGANQGFWSLFFAKRLPNAMILAFEPDPYHIKKFQQNIEANRFKNIKLCPYALSDSNESKDLMINTASNRAGNSMVVSQTPWTKNNDVKIKVPCKTLVEALSDNKVNSISALKIDVEGYEYQILKKFFSDAPQSLYPKAIVVEAFGYIINLVGGSPIELLITNGYRLINHCGYNYFFELQ